MGIGVARWVLAAVDGQPQPPHLHTSNGNKKAKSRCAAKHFGL
jgi:hypothetical protein